MKAAQFALPTRSLCSLVGGLIAACLTLTAQEFELPPPPVAPTVIIAPPQKGLREAAEAGPPNWYDTSNRETVRALYNGVWAPSRTASINWTGSISGCQAGTTSQAWRNSVVTGLNFLRNLAGITGSVALDSVVNAKDQEAALMFSVNRTISHYPPNSWTCYTANAAQASGNSNICYSSGALNPGCLELYMDDFGSNNAAVGHRRWILYPQTQTFGSGDVPATPGYYSGNALWVFDANYGATRPGTREPFVAWPPPGYVPYLLVPNRWSFSYTGADFSAAIMTVTKNGKNVPVSLETIENGYGENTIVWYDSSLNSSTSPFRIAPSQDDVYAVSIGNVTTSGQPRNFNYVVNVFNPAVASPGQPSVLSATPTSGSGTAQAFTFQFSDPAGYANLGVVNVLVNPSLDGRSSCYVAYSRPYNVLYLVNDSGTALLPGLTINGTGSVSNSYCTILGTGTSATGLGNVLTLTVNIQFNQLTYSADHVVYTAARNVTDGNSGWVPKSTWRVPGQTLGATVFSLGPSAGSGSTQTFSLVYRNPSGGTDIDTAQLLINSDLNAGTACYLGYDRRNNLLYLVNDANTGLLGPVVPNAGTELAQNAQCVLNGAGTTASTSGTDLKLTVNLTFKAGFSGTKLMYAAFQAVTSGNTGWEARGLWSVP